MTGTFATPASQGVVPEALIHLLDEVRRQRVNLHSLLLMRHGYLILDAYRHPYYVGMPHDVRSIAKSITALLVGIALHEGLLSSLDQPVLALFPGRTHDARKAAITLRHLLSMTSGLALTDGDSGHLFADEDALEWVLAAPMQADPGAQFVYSTSNYYLLAAVLEQVTGESLIEYACARLFGPLRIAGGRWQASRQGIPLGGAGLWLTSPDLAKIGQLILARGQWNGAPIVPADWIDAITCPQVSGVNYGFGWWIDPERQAVQMSGYGGQIVHIWPEYDLVTVMTAGVREPNALLHGWLDRYIGPAMHPDPLPENSRRQADLAAQVDRLGRPQPEPVPPLPGRAGQVAGRRWVLSDNSLGLSALTLDFGGHPAGLILEAGTDSAVLPLGLDGVLRDVPVERLGPLADHDRMAAAGRWRDDHAFVLDLYVVNNPEYWTITLTFEGERAALRWEYRLSDHAETVELGG